MKYAVGIRINTVFTCSGFLVSYLCVAYAIKCTHGKYVLRDFLLYNKLYNGLNFSTKLFKIRRNSKFDLKNCYSNYYCANH